MNYREVLPKARLKRAYVINDEEIGKLTSFPHHNKWHKKATTVYSVEEAEAIVFSSQENREKQLEKVKKNLAKMVGWKFHNELQDRIICIRKYLYNDIIGKVREDRGSSLTYTMEEIKIDDKSYPLKQLKYLYKEQDAYYIKTFGGDKYMIYFRDKNQWDYEQEYQEQSLNMDYEQYNFFEDFDLNFSDDDLE